MTIRAAFVVAAALAACVPRAGGAQGVGMDPSEFTDAVAIAIRSVAGPVPVLVKEPLRLSVGPAMQANLERLYGFCRTDAVACPTEVDRYVSAVAQVLKDQAAPIDRKAVRVLVRTTAYLDAVQASLGPGARYETRPLVDGLAAVAVVDAPSAVRPLTERDLEALSLSRDQLFDIGAANLVAALKPLETVAPARPGQIGTIAGNDYDAARVAIPEQWASLAAAQRGTLLVALPTNDVVLYISESTPAAIKALRTRATAMAARASNPLSGDAVLRWSSARWILVP